MTSIEKIIHFCPLKEASDRLSAMFNITIHKTHICNGCGEIRIKTPEKKLAKCPACKGLFYLL